MKTGSASRPGDDRFITGTGCFTSDIQLEDELRMVVVRSPHASARIVSIETAEALRCPDVVAVLTGRDYAADGWGHPTSRHKDFLGPRRNVDGSEFFAPPNVVLPPDRVRHVGDAVAIVVATSPGAASAGADLVSVDYEPLPHVTSAVDALSAGAPVVWDERPDNLCADFATGDEAAVAAAMTHAAHVVDIEVESRRVTAAPIEPRAAIGQCEPDGRMTLYVTSQGADRVRRVLVEDVLRVPAEQLRVVTRDVGGSFGMKAGVYTEYVLVLWAAKRLGRPVKWVSSRSEAFVSDTHGRDIRSRAELGLDRDGRMLALRVESIANLGAYPGPRGPMIGVFAHPLCLTGQYDIGAASYRGRVVYTNTNSVSPYRGSGQPEAALVLERLVDKAARRIGLAPDELRRRNLIPVDRFPYTTALGTTYDSGDYASVLERALQLAEFGSFVARRRDAESRGRLRGIGVSAFVEVSGGVPVEWGALSIAADGRVEVTTGIQNIGTGHETTFPQIVQERLGAPVSSVTLRYGDTEFVKSGAGTHASRSTLMAGTVLSRNMDAAILRGMQIAAHVFGAVDPANIRFRAGRFVSTDDGRSLSLSEVVQRAESGDGLPEELRGPFRFENEYLRDLKVQTASNGCQVCEVEIDRDTGSVEVVRFSAVDAVGRVINHSIVHGQVRGGIAQGIGQALLERIVYEPESGQLLTGTFVDYALPRASDLPAIAIEDYEDAPSATNPLGVKGAGEGGAIGAPAAVANAVLDALRAYGVEHLDPPYTPERVWRAMQPSLRGEIA
jgi:carbon-monoxide dehydrogenase large subunit